jgi:hypothetical protein
MMTAYLGTAALRMSEADLLPFDLETAASTWQLALAWLRESSDESEVEGVAIESLDRIAEEWRESAADLNAARRERLGADTSSGTTAAQWRDWNAKLRQVERSFYAPKGLPGSPWSRNLFSAMRFESEETTLPGLRWSIEDRNREQFDQQVSAYADALKTARDLTQQLTAELRAAETRTPSPQ